MPLRRGFGVLMDRTRSEPHVTAGFGYITSEIKDPFAMNILLGKQGEESIGAGRVLDQAWIDMNLLCRWQDECLTAHGDRCRSLFVIAQMCPAWLIDTLYMAHGARVSAQRSKTETQTLRGLELAGSLNNLPLSPTIRHAMGIVRALGER
ncbi:hypothetical protein PspLS_09767 [Pyricularia sp. CBS 133598]|nr:hypothetical protein PspLS_09767 [Pyricularia sp. CBS 133598]